MISQRFFSVNLPSKLSTVSHATPQYEPAFKRIRAKTVSHLLAESYLLSSFDHRNGRTRALEQAKICMASLDPSSVTARDRIDMSINFTVLCSAPPSLLSNSDLSSILYGMLDSGCLYPLSITAKVLAARESADRDLSTEITRLQAELQQNFPPANALDMDIIKRDPMKRIRYLLSVNPQGAIEYFRNIPDEEQSHELLMMLLTHNYGSQQQCRDDVLRVALSHDLMLVSRTMRDLILRQLNFSLHYHLSKEMLAAESIVDQLNRHGFLGRIEHADLYANMIEFFAKSGKQTEMERMFGEYRLRKRLLPFTNDSHVQSAMLHYFVHLGDVKATLGALKAILKSRLEPSDRVYSAMIKLFSTKKFIQGVDMLHNLAFDQQKYNLRPSYFQQLLKHFTKSGQPHQALDVFMGIVDSWKLEERKSINRLIPEILEACRQVSEDDERDILGKIHTFPIIPSTRASSALTRYYAKSQRTDEAIDTWMQSQMYFHFSKLVQKHMLSTDISADNVTVRAVSSWRELSLSDYKSGLIAYGHCKDTEGMFNVFTDMLVGGKAQPDNSFFKTWISLASHSADPKSTTDIFLLAMLRRNPHDKHIYKSLMEKYADNVAFQKWIENCHHSHKDRNVIPQRNYMNLGWFNHIIRSYALCGDAKNALKWTENIKNALGQDPGISSHFALNYLFDLEHMDIDTAQKLLKHAHYHGNFAPEPPFLEIEEMMFGQTMMGTEIDPDPATANKSFLPIERVTKPRAPSILVLNSIIWAFGRAGDTQSVRNLINSMLRKWNRSPDLTTWNGLMKAYQESEDHDNVLDLWRYLVEHYKLETERPSTEINQRTVEMVLKSCLATNNIVIASEVIRLSRKIQPVDQSYCVTDNRRNFDPIWKRTTITHLERVQRTERNFPSIRFPEFLAKSRNISFDTCLDFYKLKGDRKMIEYFNCIAAEAKFMTERECADIYRNFLDDCVG